jgi:hypothetical protein
VVTQVIERIRTWRVKTWQVELAVVSALLAGVAIASRGGGFVEMLGAAAVVLTFCHAQVADRLAEREGQRERALAAQRALDVMPGHDIGVGQKLKVTSPGVLPPGFDAGATYTVVEVRGDAIKLFAPSCHRWAARYLVAKEVLWLAYFVLHHSWSALAGVFVFLAYPLWRRWWRRRHPPPAVADLRAPSPPLDPRRQWVGELVALADCAASANMDSASLPLEFDAVFMRTYERAGEAARALLEHALASHDGARVTPMPLMISARLRPDDVAAERARRVAVARHAAEAMGYEPGEVAIVTHEDNARSTDTVFIDGGLRRGWRVDVAWGEVECEVSGPTPLWHQARGASS